MRRLRNLDYPVGLPTQTSSTRSWHV